MPLRLLSILLVSVMMYKPILCTWTVVDFALNRDYIATFLCENQDRPELECQGKCFLMTKLKKQINDSENHMARQLTELSKIELMDVQSITKFHFSNTDFITIEGTTRVNVCTGFLAGIFHPPIA